MSEFKEYHNANHHDGDNTFDDQTYKMTNGEDFDDQFVQDCFDHFKAGQQSQQAKIDLLEKELIETQDFLNKQNHIKQAKIDELQGRIDGALKILDGMRHNGAYRAIDILKGNKDEN